MNTKKAKYRLIFARKGLNKEGKGLIQIEIAFNRLSRKLISTGISVQKNQWDEKNKNINRKHLNFIRLNEIIQKQLSDIETFELELLRKEKTFGPAALKKYFNYGGDDFFTLAKISINRDGKLGDNSRPRVLQHLETFNRVCGPVSVNELAYIKVKEFDKWLKTQGYLTNTIGSYHKDLKRTINALIREGEIQKNPYDQFSIVKVKTRRTYLTPPEVEKIAALSYNNGIQATLDRFLISCGTALRFSDCFMLHSRQIYEGEAGRGLVIDLSRMVKVEFPIKIATYQYFNAVADQRLRKYIETDEFLFFRKGMSISSQNTIDNQNLKLIAMDAGINKDLSFHASRHTALTEVAAQTGSVFSVMKFGGIRKVDTAMIYVHLASEKF